ncbi:MAG: GNAT family N-acetyltransferase [Planctomycetaceae bacterium]|nr:GNAT family N-acetyltransferase [Planctomycetaceae bacterium]
MIEVRTFDGTAEELSDFVVGQWTASYRGRMAVPRWSADYFRWQVSPEEPGTSDCIIGAYDGTRLVGLSMLVPFRFQLQDEQLSGSQASWLSVDPEFRGRGIAGKLVAASRERHIHAGRAFQFGYAYFGSRFSLGPKFWLRRQMSTTRVLRRVGFWARVLDPSAAANWNLDRFQRTATRILSPVMPSPRMRHPAGIIIRSAEEKDVSACLRLAEEATRHCPFRILWDAGTLRRQLGFNGFSSGLVAEAEGAVRGFVTFHLLPLIGRTEEPFGIVDQICVDQLSTVGQTELLNAALITMQEAGAVTALKLRSGDYPRGLLLRHGWLFRPSDSHAIITWTQDPPDTKPVRNMHVLWR